MSKRKSYERLYEWFKERVESECPEYSPECLKMIGNYIAEFEQWSWSVHESAKHKKSDEEAWAGIQRAVEAVSSMLTSEIAPELAREAYEAQVSRGQHWFSEATAQRISEALFNALTTNPEATPRDVVESIISQTGLSIVTVRHYLSELAREIPEYSIYATEARRMERERLGV